MDYWSLLRKVLLVFAILFVQQLPGVSGAGVDLPLIFVVLMGLRKPMAQAVAWGALLGFLQDALSADWLGLHLTAKVLAALISSAINRHAYREKIAPQGFLIFLMVWLQQTVVWLLLKWDGSAPGFSSFLLVLERTLLGTTLAGVLVSFWVVRFRRRRMDPATA